MDAGNVIIASYVLYAALAWKLYNMPQPYWDFLPMRFFPFVYLFLMLLLALWPVLRFDSRQITSIEQPSSFVLHTTAGLITCFALVQIPSILQLLHEGGLMQILTNPDMGQEKYLESIQEAGESGSGISNLTAIVLNAFSDIAILLFFYYLTLPKKHWLLIGGLSLAVIMHILMPIMSGLRGSVVVALFTIIAAYFLMRSYLSARLRKWIDVTGIVLFCIIAIPLAAITISRFNSEDGGAGGSVVYYGGQAPLNFNNYGLDAGGIRNGDRTFNLVKKLIDPSTPINYVDRREKYFYLKMDDNIFYTFVGDFTLDFGPYIAPLIFLLFTGLILLLTKPQENSIAFHQLLLIYLVVCICMQGGMLLFTYSDTAGLKLVVLFCLYIACACTTRRTIQS